MKKNLGGSDLYDKTPHRVSNKIIMQVGEVTYYIRVFLERGSCIVVAHGLPQVSHPSPLSHSSSVVGLTAQLQFSILLLADSGLLVCTGIEHYLMACGHLYHC